MSISGPGEDRVVTDYGVYTVSARTTKLSFDRAEAVCRVTGAHLAVLESRQEHESLEPLVPDGKDFHHRLGGRDLDGTRKFVWVPTGLKLSETFTKWHPNRPVSLSTHPTYLCLALTNNGWNDVPCTSSYNFICEY